VFQLALHLASSARRPPTLMPTNAGGVIKDLAMTGRILGDEGRSRHCGYKHESQKEDYGTDPDASIRALPSQRRPSSSELTKMNKPTFGLRSYVIRIGPLDRRSPEASDLLAHFGGAETAVGPPVRRPMQPFSGAPWPDGPDIGSCRPQRSRLTEGIIYRCIMAKNVLIRSD
jgi:hypothetical protein